ncbi:MAG: PAS domain S-box protein [Marinilabilia sp.]
MTTKATPENISAFKTLFDIATDGIFIEDETGTIIECNPAAEKIFGYLHGELKNVHISKLVPPDFAATLPKVITDEHITGDVYLERINMKKDGTIFPTEICTKWALAFSICARLRSEKEVSEAQ